MTVLLVLFTFVTFLTIDYLRTRHTVSELAAHVPTTREEHVAEGPQPALAGGFEIRENLRYHPGHTWALTESPNLVRVGMDDFASKLTGKVERITLPKRGQWIRQGQKLCTLYRDEVAVDMVSPIEGTVAEINEAIMKDASAAKSDPYGEGWLVTVQAPDAKTCLRNLLGGPLARWWTEESASRLRGYISLAGAAAYAQDGGAVVDNLTAAIPTQKWLGMAREFFLT